MQVTRCIFISRCKLLKSQRSILLKKTRKIIAAVIAAMTAVTSITACSADYSHINGYSDVENARKLYASLYSAELTVTDKGTGTVTQELTFCYDQNDTLSYSYFGTDGNTKYYEYHNGSEYNYYSDGEWHTLVSGDQNYVSYNRTNKMSMTDEGMIFIKPDCVTGSEVKETADGKTVTMQYDVSKLNDSMSAQLGLVGDLDSFSVVYNLDRDGYCTSMEQIGYATKDGTQGKVDYLMTITHMNDVAAVEKPEVDGSSGNKSENNTDNSSDGESTSSDNSNR